MKVLLRQRNLVSHMYPEGYGLACSGEDRGLKVEVPLLVTYRKKAGDTILVLQVAELEKELKLARQGTASLDAALLQVEQTGSEVPFRPFPPPPPPAPALLPRPSSDVRPNSNTAVQPGDFPLVTARLSHSQSPPPSALHSCALPSRPANSCGRNWQRLRGPCKMLSPPSHQRIRTPTLPPQPWCGPVRWVARACGEILEWE